MQAELARTTDEKKKTCIWGFLGYNLKCFFVGYRLRKNFDSEPRALNIDM